MMNLVSFETTPPPLRREERVQHGTTTMTTSTIGSKDACSRSTFFDGGHLDLSLGMSSMSPGGGVDTSGCSSGTRASDSHRGGNCSSGITTVTPAVELSAGHGHVGELRAVAALTSAFMQSTTGFIMHPWSLAARQQKAAAEKDRLLAAAYMPSEQARAIPLPTAVGWPPVHTSRRNLVTAMHTTTNSDATVVTVVNDGLKDDVAVPAGNNKNPVMASTRVDSTVVVVDQTRTTTANMFAKVYMEGYTIARKVNLRAHGSYDSLSRVLTKMTRNFFCPADCSVVGTGEGGFYNTEKFLFLYEDFEGDRMLVGDVPWELFLASAKRLYIVRNPVPGNKGHVDSDKIDTTEKVTDK